MCMYIIEYVCAREAKHIPMYAFAVIHEMCCMCVRVCVCYAHVLVYLQTSVHVRNMYVHVENDYKISKKKRYVACSNKYQDD